MQFHHEYPETLRDLAYCIEQALGQIAADPAADPAFIIVEAIRFRFGGSLLYIPKGDKMTREIRNAELCAAFTGHNHRELALRYHLGLAAVYDIIAAHRNTK